MGEFRSDRRRRRVTAVDPEMWVPVDVLFESDHDPWDDPSWRKRNQRKYRDYIESVDYVSPATAPSYNDRGLIAYIVVDGRWVPES